MFAGTALMSAAPEVFEELAKAALPAESKAFLAALSAVEAPKGFLELFGGELWAGPLDKFPDWPGLLIPGDSLGRKSHAFGAWQFLGSTWNLIAGMTHVLDVRPQSQIGNAWVLAVRDFQRNGGGDLLSALKAGRLDDVHEYLFSTWPGGADANFPARYRAALPRFDALPPAPPASDPALELPLGMQVAFPISGSIKGHPMPVPADAVTSDAPNVCRVEIADDAIIFVSVALGRAHAGGKDISVDIDVVSPDPDHIEIDFSRPTFSRIAGGMMARLPLLAGVGAVALMLLTQPAGMTEPPVSRFAASDEGEKMNMPEPADAETFCFGRDHGFPITICRRP